jgi:hypothetical protein
MESGTKYLRISFASVFVVLALTEFAGAQQLSSPASADRLRLALTSPGQLELISPELPRWMAPDARRFGILTLVPPKATGEFVSVVVPVGDLTMRAARAVREQQQRRAERKAQDAVQRALQSFQAQQPGR